MARSIKKNFAFNSAYQILNIIVPLVTTPYLSRTIGATGNGLFTYTQSIANYFVLFANLGITNYGVREIASCGDDRAKRSRTFWNLFAMNLVSGFTVAAVYFAYCFTLGAENLLLSLLWSLWVIGAVVDVTWLLNGCQEFKVPMVRNFCTRLAGMCLIFLLVHSESDTWAYVFSIATPYLANALLVWPFTKRYVDHVRPTWREMLPHFKPNLLLFIPVIATSLYTLLDKVMLGAMAGMEQAGLYDYAEKISKMPMAIITALGAVVLPRMTEVIAAGRHDEAKGLVGTTMWFMEACAMALTFGIIAVAPEFVPAFFGAGYEECVPLMRILSVIIPLICATNVIGVQYLVPSHRDRAFTISVLVGAAVNISINAVTLTRWGAMAAAFATVAAEISVLVAQALFVRGELDLARALVGALPFVTIGLAMTVVIRLLAWTLGTAGTASLFGLVLEVAVGGTFYLACSVAFCRLTHNEHFAQLFPRLA